ncbi:MAG: hypothetical protein F2840_11870 [Actinobacteria bacterium]|jgi:hypothetical protein|uniref:Unannotated protein n=1 Tax=freshwater metagenome TaxID=449393 RepID=A0A6J7LBQ4_9ZZZZ|nr:hypothetical protein [Actinomycetota bacterium]
MDDWISAACLDLGISPPVNIPEILDLARDAAHNVERPAAPISTYLLGYAVAQGADLTEAAARLSRLATGWVAQE